MSDHSTTQEADRDRGQPLSRAALWSMFFGVLSLCLGPLGLVALVMGIVGITRTSKPGGPGGRSFAIAGSGLGATGLIGSCLVVGFLVWKARQTTAMMLSHSQMRQIQIGVHRYHVDTGETLPEEGWKPILSDHLVGTPDDPIFTSPLSDGDALEYVFVPGKFAYDDSLIMFYEDPDQTISRDRVNVVYDGGQTASIPIADLEAELMVRGHTLKR